MRSKVEDVIGGDFNVNFGDPTDREAATPLCLLESFCLLLSEFLPTRGPYWSGYFIFRNHRHRGQKMSAYIKYE